MLNTQDQQALVSHAKYSQLIRRVARQETYRSNSIYGYRILDAEDIAQDLIIQLIRTDIGVEALDNMRVAEAWLRHTTRYMAQNAVDKAIGAQKDKTGRRVGRVDTIDTTDFTADYITRGVFVVDAGPEEAIVARDHYDRIFDDTSKVIRGIIGKVENPLHREALVGYYLRGETFTRTMEAARKRRRRGQLELTPKTLPAYKRGGRSVSRMSGVRPPSPPNPKL